MVCSTQSEAGFYNRDKFTEILGQIQHRFSVIFRLKLADLLARLALRCKYCHEQAARGLRWRGYRRKHSAILEQPMTDFYNLVPSAPTGRFDGIERPYSPDDVKRLRGSVQIRQYSRRNGCQPAVETHPRGGFRQRARRHVGQPGDAAGTGRAEGDLPVGLAGCRRCQHRIGHVSGPVALSRQCGAGTGQAHQPHAAARRPDRDFGRQGAVGRHLVRADRRRCGSRFRRTAQRLRDHEGVHRGGRCRRPLRGPAGFGEEVRPSRRQGADPDRGAYPQPQRGAPGRRRDGHADAGRRAHRRRGSQAADLRHRRARPALRRLRRRPHGRGLLPGQERHRAVHRARGRLRALLPT